MASEKKVSVRLSVEADNLDAVRQKLEALGVTVKAVGNDTSADKLKRQFEALEARLDPTARAAQRLAREQALLNAALAAGATSQERYAQLLRASEQVHQQAQRAAAASVASTTSLGAAMDRAGGSAGRMGGVMSNLGFQVQDAAVQLQMGTNALVVLAQQGSQFAGAFGPVGAVIGAVIAVAATAAMVLGGLNAEEKAAAELATAHKAAQEALTATLASSASTVDDLAGRYRTLTAEMRAFEQLAVGAALRRLDEEQKKLQEKVTLKIGDLQASAEYNARLDAGLAPPTGEAAAVAASWRAVGAAIADFQRGGDVVKLATDLAAVGQNANEAGTAALKVADALVVDGRASREAGESKRALTAQSQVLAGQAAVTAGALFHGADAADSLARGLQKVRQAEAVAGASLFTTERDLDAQIAALKKGADGIEEWNRQKAKQAAYSKAYDDAIKSGLGALDAQAEATRIATKAVEAYNLTLASRAATKVENKAETQAQRDAKAYATLTAELDRDVAAQQRLAGAVGQSVAQQREANTQTRIAEALSKAHVKAGSDEAKAIEEKVRAAEKWKAVAADGRTLDAAEEQLAYARQDLALMREAGPLRDRALASIRIQRDAVKLFGDTTSDAARRWIALQEQIADVQAVKAYQQEVQRLAQDIARDWSETLFDALVLKDKKASIIDAAKALGKRIALAFLETNIVLPITMQVVGAVPGAFGIQAPAGAAGGGGGGLTGGAMNWGIGKGLSWAGDKLGLTGAGGGITGAIDSFGLSTLGIGTATSTVIPGVGGAAATTAATTLNPATGSLAAYNSWGAAGAQGAGSGVAAGTGLSAYLGTAGIGAAAGGMLGSWAGNAAGGNKLVGGGVGAVGGAAAAGLASYMGIGAALGPWGIALGALAGAIMGAIGTQKPSNREGNATLDVPSGAISIGGQEGKKFSQENRDRAGALMAGVAALAGGLEAILPGRQIDAGNAFVAIGDRDATRARYGDQSADFGKKGDTAGVFDWFAKQLVTDMRDSMEAQDVTSQVAENVLTVLDRGVGASVEQFLSDLTFAATDFSKAYDGVGKAGGDQFSETMTALSVDFQTARDRAAALGLTTDGMGDSFGQATTRLLDSATRAARGLGAVDSVLAAMESWRRTSIALMGAGQDPQPAMTLLGHQLSAIVNAAGDGIDGLQKLTEAAATLRAMGETTGAAFAELRASQVREQVTDDISLRDQRARIALLTDPAQQQAAQAAYDLRALEIQQRNELLAVTDAAIKARLVEVQALERQTLVAKQAAAAQADLAAKQQALVTAGGSIRAWIDQQRATAGVGVTPQDALGSAQDAFSRDLALARGGDSGALGRITQTADRLLAAQTAVTASGADTQLMRQWVLASLDTLPATRSYEQQMLEALQALGGSVNVAVELTTIRVITEQLNALPDADRARLTQSQTVLRSVEERVGRHLSDAELAALVTAATVERSVTQTLGRDLSAGERAALVAGGAVERAVVQALGRDLSAGERAALVAGGAVERTVVQALGRDLSAAERDGLVAAGSVIRTVEQQLGRALTTAEQAAIVLPGSVTRTIGQTVAAATGADLIAPGTVTRKVTQDVTETVTSAAMRDLSSGLQVLQLQTTSVLINQLHTLGVIINSGAVNIVRAITGNWTWGAGLATSAAPHVLSTREAEYLARYRDLADAWVSWTAWDPTNHFYTDGIKEGRSFANGGVMTAAGPLRLTAYSNGGIATGPELALFGEGRLPEAFVPLPDGRSIPVTMRAPRAAAPPPAGNDNGGRAVVAAVDRLAGKIDTLIQIAAAGGDLTAAGLGDVAAGVQRVARAVAGRGVRE